MSTTEEFGITELERKACETVNKAFERNKLYWQDDHDRQHRLFNMILSAPIPEKPDVVGRSNVKTGTSWMIHQLIFSILKNSLLTLTKNVRLDPTATRPVIFWQDEMQDYLDRLISDPGLPVHDNLRHCLFDLISHGTGVIRPYYRDDLRMVWDGKEESEVLNYSGPDMPYIASWDVYPTAGVTSPDECHEIVFYEYYYPHELRALEKAGKLRNVEQVLQYYREPSWLAKGDSENKDPRQQHGDSDLRMDSSGRIGVLVYWGLFPYYEDVNYIDDEGGDRSQDEVECLIIKPVDKDIPLYFDRNPYYHQEKEAIFAKYFDIPGMFWGESIFGVLERMLIHQEDWFNIIQDSANQEVYRDRVFSDAIPPEQRQQKGVGRDYVVDGDLYQTMRGDVMHYLDRGNAILPDTYEQLTNVDRFIQQVSAIMDFLRATSAKQPKTATEVEELAASLNIRFEQSAMQIGNTFLVPAMAWSMSMLASEYANDEHIAQQLGTPVNPFKQFSPMMPNQGYRIKLEGSLRSVQNVALQGELRDLIAQAQTIPPGMDENGELVQVNVMQMFLDEIKLSKLQDTDKYKIPFVPPTTPIGPGGPVLSGVGQGDVNVPGA
jgi:hypothetical protein